MATWHNVHFGTTYPTPPITGVFLKLGPTDEGALWIFGQFRIPEHTGGWRVKGIEIPFAPGLKDVGDGARTGGTVTVEGWVHYTDTHTSDTAAKTIISKFAPGGLARKDFFAWYSYGAGAAQEIGNVEKLRCLQSWRIAEVEGWGGERWDVSLTFPVFDPEF